jgi:hypothetical protein
MLVSRAGKENGSKNSAQRGDFFRTRVLTDRSARLEW